MHSVYENQNFASSRNGMSFPKTQYLAYKIIRCHDEIVGKNEQFTLIYLMGFGWHSLNQRSVCQSLEVSFI